MSWSLSSLADRAESLLQSADKRANEEIEKVKERAGILKTPAVAGEDQGGDGEEPVVVLSKAVAVLLSPEERSALLDSGTATIEGDGVASEPPSTPAADGELSESEQNS